MSHVEKVLRVFIEGDTHTIRVLMAVASIIFGVGLWLPLGMFQRLPFAGMAEVMGEFQWGVLFVLHGVLVFWRTFDPVPRRWWAFWINAYGLVLWILYVGLVNKASGTFTIGTSMEITVLLAAFVALVRTGVNEHEKISP